MDPNEINSRIRSLKIKQYIDDKLNFLFNNFKITYLIVMQKALD